MSGTKKTPEISGVLSWVFAGVSALTLATLISGSFTQKDAKSIATRGFTESLFVFSSADECQEQGNVSCNEKWDQAKEISNSIQWGFETQGDCQQSHGDYCVEIGGKWKPEMAAVAVYRQSSGYFSSAIPVYSSSNFPGMYLPNGYPVVPGKNTVGNAFLSVGVMKSYEPQDLSEKVCLEDSGEEVCKPFYQFVSGIQLKWSVIRALF
jgi:hypothetical protein